MNTAMSHDYSVPVLLRNRALSNPDGILIQSVEGSVLTNAEFHQQAINVADGLCHHGVKAGDCVATLLDTCVQSHPLWIGISWAQALEVPINPEFKGNTLAHGLNDSKAKILITSNSMLPKLEVIFERLNFFLQIITIDTVAPTTKLSVATLHDFLAVAPALTHQEPKITDAYAVIYTSGTTGLSKGVKVPWQSIQYSIQQLFSGDDITDYADPAFYSPWPAFHSSGKVGLVFAAVQNARFVMRGRLSIRAYWADICEYGCTHTQLLGLAGLLMAQATTDTDKQKNDADNPLTRVLMNPVLPEFKEFERQFGVTVSTGWGMTEIGFPLACSNPPNHTTCGKLAADYKVRLVDDNDQEVAIGEVGQLIIQPLKQGLLLIEYLYNPEATEKAWQDGWFYTGDALRCDVDGYYYFVDRVADYIRVRGNNVSSMEVETEVLVHACVGACVAIAIPAELGVLSDDPKRVALSEDEIKIVVIKKPAVMLSESELFAYLTERMPRFMLPRYIEFVDELPMTPTGKVQKKILREKCLTPNTWDQLKEI